MKKILPLVLIPVLAAGAFLIWQNLPTKRFARHMVKARLFSKENNLTAARLEYEKAFAVRGNYTPYVDLEVLNLTNRANIQNKNLPEALNNTKMFVKEHPTNQEGKIVLARLALQLGETETAFDALNSALETDAWFFPARLLLTDVRIKQGRLDLAEEQLRYLYSKYPDSVASLLPLAEVLIQQGRVEESRGFLARILEKDPAHSRARLLMVDTYLRERKIDSAQAMLDSWKEEVPGQIQPVQIRKARLYSLANRLPEAKQALAAYREPKTENLQALSELAIIHVKDGQYDSAIAVYKTMGEVSPATRMNAESMALYLHLKNRNPARALEALKALQITDKRPMFMPPLIAAYLAIGQENKAADFIAEQPDSLQKPLKDFMAQLVPDKEFIGEWALFTYYGLTHQDFWAFQSAKALFTKWPKSELAITLCASNLAKVGNTAEAAKVLATLPNPNLTHRMALLQLLSQSGQGDKAIALAEAISKEQPNMAGLNIILANHWMKKDKAKAMAHYERELAINPSNPIALNNLAWEYGIVQANLEKATPYLDKLKATKNLDPRILDTIGWILAVNGKLDEGERHVGNALDLIPDQPTFQYHLAWILNKAGKKDAARKQLEAALASKRPFDERKEAEKLLVELG
jgi:tetratricopeptide (TPR) repeat protein